MKLINTSVSVTEPVTLDEVKTHLRIETTDEDAYLSSLIAAARGYAEQLCNAVIPQQTFKVVLDSFEDTIKLPVAPVISIDSIEYIDGNNTLQTLSDFYLDQVFSFLRPGYGKQWPETLPGYEKVTISLTAGYSLVPDPIKQAILLTIGAMYEQRENSSEVKLHSVPMSTELLLSSYRRVPR